MNAAGVRGALRKLGSTSKAHFLKRFFKTGPGQYGEGDAFLGVTVPRQREVAKRFRDLPLAEVLRLLHSKMHEERMTALCIMVSQFQRGDEAVRQRIFKAYLANRRWVNNWDLVDTSAPHIVGAWLLSRPQELLFRLAASKQLWDRRIAMVATQGFIRRGQAGTALKLAVRLLRDGEDLMHKATGWMLREVGIHCGLDVLRKFLRKHAARMPRTMLRYAIEKMDASERRRWMGWPDG